MLFETSERKMKIQIGVILSYIMSVSLGTLLFNLPIESRKSVRNLEKVSAKVIRQKCSLLFNSTCLRPISLLSNINKVLEKLMFNRVYAFLEKFECIYSLSLSDITSWGRMKRGWSSMMLTLSPSSTGTPALPLLIHSVWGWKMEKIFS